MKVNVIKWTMVLAAIWCSPNLQATVQINGTNVTASDMDYLIYRRHWRIPIANQTGSAWESGNSENLEGKTPAEIHAIVVAHGALETNSYLTQIDWKWMSDSEVFSFFTVAMARQEATLRMQSVLCLNAMNTNHKFWYNITMEVYSRHRHLAGNITTLEKVIGCIKNRNRSRVIAVFEPKTNVCRKMVEHWLVLPPFLKQNRGFLTP